ncbi:hypothetical protein, partial [Sphingobium yanoikuyae]|uniref:hypothetical protein n=1 Tax=Sphingobium yanoikuyae TaxID=13690 RepID=UPI002FDD12C6
VETYYAETLIPDFPNGLLKALIKLKSCEAEICHQQPCRRWVVIVERQGTRSSPGDRRSSHFAYPA